MITLSPIDIQRFTETRDGRPARRLAECHDAARQSLRARAALLPRHDRLILEMVCIDLMPVRRVAEVLETDPGTVSRRARQLARRALSPFVSVVMDSGDALSDVERTVAVQAYVSRAGVTALSRTLGVSTWEVRRLRAFVFGWYRGRTGKSPS